VDLPPARVLEAKSGLKAAALPEAFLVSLYRVLAPYRGCGHGCRYCDGRAEKYYVEGDFVRDVAARANLPDLVAADVASGAAAREYGAACIGSGVTDVYQPLEAELGLTRRTLEALLPSGLPLVILTKSDLILRDFELLARFPKALVIVTVTTVDPIDAGRLEPGAAAPAARLEVVRRAKSAGFAAGIMAMPFCPGITDTPESVGALLAAARTAGADFVYPGGLTLRPGRQKDEFMSLVDADYPGLRPRYEELYRENRPSGRPVDAAAGAGAGAWDGLVRAAGFATMIPHRVYRELLAPPDALYVLFSHLAQLYAARGVDVRPLGAAAGRYDAWLKAERSGLRRRRLKPVPSDPFPLTRTLTEKLAALAAAPGGLAKLLGNAKLAALAAEVLVDGRIFDYPSLRLDKR
jgi:DNA repair photolyase